MLNNFSKIYFLRKESEQFLNNVEQKIILCKMLEIVYAKNSEQFLWENSEQFYLMQKLNSYFELKYLYFTMLLFKKIKT